MNRIAKIIDNKTVEVFDLSQFDLDAIMHSGQVFRYFKTQDGYTLIAGAYSADIKENNGKVIITTESPDFFYEYFDLNTDYNSYKKTFENVKFLQNAISAGGGIRILKAPFFETVISFIISANNNIKRFTKTLNILSEQFGTKLANGLYAFPTLTQLEAATEDDFKAFGCGYRAAYLVKAVKQLKELDLTALNDLSNDRLIKALQKFCGVGPKVAACIMLFSGDLHKLDSFPIDTWIDKNLQSMPDFQKSILLNHPYKGLLQQYIFYYSQHLRKNI